MKVIYIYALLDPRTREVRYVGKTTDPRRRLFQHVWRAKEGYNNHTYKTRWIKKLLLENLQPEMSILEECSEVNWQEREVYWISQFSNLTNTAPGGQAINIPRTPEWGRRISEALKGRVISEEHREKLRQANLGKRKGYFGCGHPYTPENIRTDRNGLPKCLICKRESVKRSGARRRRERGMKPRDPTHCNRGHSMSGENLKLRKRTMKDGRIRTLRVCRECVRIRNREYKKKKRKRDRMRQQMPNREPWEISYCVRVNFAKSYLKYLAVEGRERAMLQTAYRTEDIREWAKERITQVLEQARVERNGRLLSTVAQDVVQGSVDALVETGLFGIAPNADITRTETLSYL